MGPQWILKIVTTIDVANLAGKSDVKILVEHYKGIGKKSD